VVLVVAALFGTTMASGGIGSLVDIEPNGAYIKSPPAPYVDPSLPWVPSPSTSTFTITRDVFNGPPMLSAFSLTGVSGLESLGHRDTTSWRAPTAAGRATEHRRLR